MKTTVCRSSDHEVSGLMDRITELRDAGIVWNLENKNAVAFAELFFKNRFDFGLDVFKNPGAVFDFKDGKLDPNAKPFQEFCESGSQPVFFDVVDDEVHDVSPMRY